MKKIISTLLLATFCIFTQLHAQNRADELMKQAQENLTKKNISKPAIYSCKPTMPLPRKTSMSRQWNAASMPAPSTIGRITIKKLLNCCAVPSKWWQPRTENGQGHAQPTFPHQQGTPADVHQPEKSRTCQGTADQTGRDRQSLSQRL